MTTDLERVLYVVAITLVAFIAVVIVLWGKR